jgi:hypothetical protein
MVLAFVGYLIFAYVVSPPPAYILIAKHTIPAGTRLSDVPDSWLHNASISSEASVVNSLVTQSQLRTFQKDGAVVIETIQSGEPLRLSAIVSADNPAAQNRSVLALADPNLVSIVLPVTNLPVGIDVGGCVDLIAAVNEVRINQTISYQSEAPAAPGYILPPGTSVGAPTMGPTVTLMPTVTPTPPYGTPLAKTIVSCATVLNIVRDPSVSANMQSNGSQNSNVSVGQGEVKAIEVAIPRVVEEFVVMASAAGKLQISQVSILAKGASTGPSVGASIQDLIDLFYSDREAIKKNGTPTPIPFPTSVPITETPAS